VHAAREGFADELLRFHPFEATGPISLQLGGADPVVLAEAAAIGARLGYHAINLNCGCPSAAVAGAARRSGAALMREPRHVAACCRAMQAAVAFAGSDAPVVSVKHRLGVVDAREYRRADDADAAADYAAAHAFIAAVHAESGVRRFHVHARKAILGITGLDEDSSVVGGDTGQAVDDGPVLWVPGGTSAHEAVKVNHQRVQYQAKQRARRATVANRDVPPLRPQVVHALASSLPSLELVLNGGVDSVSAAYGHLGHARSSSSSSSSDGAGIAGVMVGRAALNHPCVFAAADRTLFVDAAAAGRVTRGEVIAAYVAYVEEEEARMAAAPALRPVKSDAWAAEAAAERRRALVAPAFNLFAGEVGCEGFRRRLRKLSGRRKVGEAYTAAGLLRAALAEVPTETLLRPLTEAQPVADLPSFEHAPRRAGPMQASVW
jgi:tRNA-dihydrouridine synthase